MTEPTPLDAEVGEIEAPLLNVTTSLNTDGDGIGRLTDLVDAARAPYTLDTDRKVFVVPDGHDLHIVDTEPYGLSPATRRGTVNVSTPRSLATYVNRHADQWSTLWADTARTGRNRGGMPTITAVLDDDHKIDDTFPAWREHRAVLTLAYTKDWTDWTGIDGAKLDQLRFAEFIEDHVANIVHPTPADMLELAQTFEATKSVDFESANRLSSSERRLVWKETVAARAGQRGDLTVPEVIRLRLSVFEGVEPVEVLARFRYRIAAGDLALTVVLDRPDEVIDRTFEVILDDIVTWTARPVPEDESMLGVVGVRIDAEEDRPVHRLDVMFGNPGPARR